MDFKPVTVEREVRKKFKDLNMSYLQQKFNVLDEGRDELEGALERKMVEELMQQKAKFKQHETRTRRIPAQNRHQPKRRNCG